mmetsp:Transcript_44499/g.144493  ORF Transcript_44499/g.144493 Transcript_44499/m.144493 type:complete len:479 (-) Transcript_44499:502-1938(-)
MDQSSRDSRALARLARPTAGLVTPGAASDALGHHGDVWLEHHVGPSKGLFLQVRERPRAGEAVPTVRRRRRLPLPYALCKGPDVLCVARAGRADCEQQRGTGGDGRCDRVRRKRTALGGRLHRLLPLGSRAGPEPGLRSHGRGGHFRGRRPLLARRAEHQPRLSRQIARALEGAPCLEHGARVQDRGESDSNRLRRPARSVQQCHVAAVLLHSQRHPLSPRTRRSNAAQAGARAGARARAGAAQGAEARHRGTCRAGGVGSCAIRERRRARGPRPRPPEGGAARGRPQVRRDARAACRAAVGNQRQTIRPKRRGGAVPPALRRAAHVPVDGSPSRAARHTGQRISDGRGPHAGPRHRRAAVLGWLRQAPTESTHLCGHYGREAARAGPLADRAASRCQPRAARADPFQAFLDAPRRRAGVGARGKAAGGRTCRKWPVSTPPIPTPVVGVWRVAGAVRLLWNLLAPRVACGVAPSSPFQ